MKHGLWRNATVLLVNLAPRDIIYSRVDTKDDRAKSCRCQGASNVSNIACDGELHISPLTETTRRVPHYVRHRTHQHLMPVLSSLHRSGFEGLSAQRFMHLLQCCIASATNQLD